MAHVQAGAALPDSGGRTEVPVNLDVCDGDLLTRFLSHRDETAFAALVQRHGGVVWGVCRRLLQQDQDAEDAFQAVFFLLARKAASIRKGQAVGSWLYGAAYRTALKERRALGRRRQREQQAAGAAPEQPPWSEPAFRELQGLLDAEVQRLPEKYRAPFVLCCLEGLSKSEAARQLGWKEGTVSGRTTQARKLLQRRLLRRGVTLSTALTALALWQNTTSAAAPAALLRATARAVLSPPGGQAPRRTPLAVAVSLAGSLPAGVGWGGLALGLALLVALCLLVAGATRTVPGPSSDSRKGPGVEATAVRLAERAGPPGRRPGPVFDHDVVTLAFSPDGKRLVTAGARPDHPGHLKVWDVEAAEALFTLGGIPGTGAVAFAPDGQTLATGEFSGTLRLRDTATGQERAAWPAHPGGVGSVRFSPDGRSLASTGLDGTVTVWDVEGRQERQRLVGHTGAVLAAAYFHHSPSLVTGGRDQTAIVWDLATGQEHLRLQGHEGGVEALAVSPDDRLVATAGRDGTVRLWDAQTGQAAAVLEAHDGPVAAVAFSPDGRFLAGTAGRRIWLWDSQTHDPVASLEPQAAGISALDFSPGGNYLASGGPLGLVLLALHFTDDGKPAPRTVGGQEYRQSFKGRVAGWPGWRVYGKGAEERVHFEPEGLRISLPLGEELDYSGTGVSAPLVAGGDFEITVNFEILHEPMPQDAGPETRVALVVFLDPQKPSGRNQGLVSRRVSPQGPQFKAWQAWKGEKTNSRSVATQALTGRLRLRRTGALLSSYAAEGFDGEFTLLGQLPFGKEDVQEVRLMASPGGPKATFEARVTDLEIHADSLRNLPEADAPAAAPGANPPGGEGAGGQRSLDWLVAAALVVIVVVLSVGGVLLVVRRRRADEARPREPSAQKSAPADTAQRPITVPCPGCGRKVKAKAELAGKRVKCPHCAAAVEVPGQ
jgi:RNA polymerase sigma factor (sigma-70 family)